MSGADEARDRARVLVYRCGCRYCDIAQEELTALCARRGATLEVRDAGSDPSLGDYAEWATPTVYVDGLFVSGYRLCPKDWDAAIRGRTGGKPL